MTTVDMSALERESPRLHRVVIRQLGIPATGEQEVDLDGLGQYSKGELFAWITEYDRVRKSAVTPPQPPAPQLSMDEIIREDQADRQEAADVAAAKNRLTEYAAAGLEESDYNFNLIKDFVVSSATHGY
jgi:hypothetical protein